MSATPQTTFVLYSVPFDTDCQNVMDFRDSNGNLDEDIRLDYFNSLPHSQTYFDCQYIRKNSEYNVPALYDNVEQYNYIRYDNHEGRGPQYAFITSKEFVNFNTTKIMTHIDPWQNNLHNMNLGENFVVREHSPRFYSNGKAVFNRINDLPYEANVLEPINSGGLQNGLYFSKFNYNLNNIGGTIQTLWLAILYSPATFDVDFSSLYGQGLYVVYIPFDKNNLGATFTFGDSPLSSIDDVMKVVDDVRIKAVFLVPYPPFITSSTINAVVLQNVGSLQLDIRGVYRKNINRPANNSTNVSITVTLDDGSRTIANINYNNNRDIQYEPKLLEDPYLKYVFTIEGYGSFTLSPWEMSSKYINFQYGSSVSMNGAYTVLQLKDNALYSDPQSRLHKIISQTTASLPLRTDAFTEYCLTNRATLNGGLMTGIALSSVSGLVGGNYSKQIGYDEGTFSQNPTSGAAALSKGPINMPVAGNIVGTAVSAVSQINSNLVNWSNMEKSPDSVRNIGDDFNTIFNSENYGGVIGVYKKRLPEALQKNIYDYYTMFGWKINRIKAVRLYTRHWYDYKQLSGCHIDGIYNEDERLELEAIFNRGLTIWHHYSTGDEWRNYNKENAENYWEVG